MMIINSHHCTIIPINNTDQLKVPKNHLNMEIIKYSAQAS